MNKFVRKDAKYYSINFPFGDCGVTAIDDDNELEIWLKDGSLEEGDIIIEVKNILEVKADKKLFIVTHKRREE